MFGTSGSARDVICLDDEGAALTGEALDAVEQVQNAVRDNRVTGELLTPLAEPINRSLGFDVQFRVIGYAQDLQEQLALLQAMADEVKAGDQVSLDITHSFRHLPMLALLSALHLRAARQVKVEGLYYTLLHFEAVRAAYGAGLSESCVFLNRKSLSWQTKVSARPPAS